MGRNITQVLFCTPPLYKKNRLSSHRRPHHPPVPSHWVSQNSCFVFEVNSAGFIDLSIRTWARFTWFWPLGFSLLFATARTTQILTGCKFTSKNCSQFQRHEKFKFWSRNWHGVQFTRQTPPRLMCITFNREKTSKCKEKEILHFRQFVKIHFGIQVLVIAQGCSSFW